MKVAVLFSGGKDSCRTVHWCLEKGYDVTLLTMISKVPDSWMFHTANIHLTELSAEAMGLPIVKKETSGIKEKELVDLKEAIRNLYVDTVACGAISSNYQRQRVEKICEELGLKFLAPFWHTDEEKFLRDTVKLGFEVIFVTVAADGFDTDWLGRKLDDNVIDDLKKLNEKHGIHICLEGGEGETLVVNAPMFKKKINITDSEKLWDKTTSSGYLKIKKAELI